MKRLLLITLFISICSSFFAQEVRKGIVTNLNYFIQRSNGINSKTFPFYFNDPANINKTHEQLSELLKKKFKLDTIIFQSDTIQYGEGYGSPDLSAKEIAKKSGEKGCLYIQILTQLRLRMMWEDKLAYNFVSKVKAFNYKGKSVYNFRNIIPFKNIPTDEITDIVNISEKDFYIFYNDGLKAAIEGGIKTFPMQEVKAPPTSYYDSVLATTEVFYITESKKGYSYGSEKDSQQEVLVFKENFLQSIDGNSIFTEIFDNNRVRDGYNVTNKFQKNDYLVKLEGGQGELFEFFTTTKPIKVEFLDNEKKLIGSLDLEWNESFLHGKLNNMDYEVFWMGDYSCYEVYDKENLIAIMKPVKEYKVAFVSKTISEETLGDLFNLIFAWDFSHHVRDKVLDKINED